MRSACVALVLAVASGAATSREHHRRLSFTPILSYSPGSQVTDHSRIDLDQKAIENYLSLKDYAKAKEIHDNGVYSKPSAVCTISSGSLPGALAKSDKIYFQSVSGTWIEGKAFTSYAATASSITFTYPVPDIAISYTFPYGTGPSESGSCWVGSLPAADYETSGCINGSTTSSTSVFAVGASGCTTGTSGGFGTCSTMGTQITASCSNQGNRTIKGFSSAAKSKMYDPSLSSSDCPTKQTTPYVSGCPYTSYEPYWNYYCASSSSPCFSDGGYANVIVNSAFLADDSASSLTHGAMSLSGADDSARKEIAKKGTAYMSIWMYAIREFEDAIDDCTNGDLVANAGSSGPVHAWDEGVAFYVGSVMNSDDIAGTATGTTLSSLGNKGYLAYSLANKRCKNFKTCGFEGDLDIGEAKVNIDLWNLFAEGRQQLLVGKCADVVPIKNQIVQKMTIPLVQGTLRYAFIQATSTPADSSKAKAEGAIFAAAVLPQVHACSSTAAETIYNNMNINYNGNIDFTAVKDAFEQCYSAMGITCAEVGGLWDGNAYTTLSGASATPSNPGANFDPSPCVDASSTTNNGGISDGVLIGIIAAGACGGVLLILLIYVIMKEKAGNPVFYSLQVKPVQTDVREVKAKP